MEADFKVIEEYYADVLQYELVQSLMQTEPKVINIDGTFEFEVKEFSVKSLSL